MKMRNSVSKLKIISFIYFFCCFNSSLFSQLSISGQLRTRTELRNGQGDLPISKTDPALFTSQRTRMTFLYKNSNLLFYTSLQDVRLWGQDMSSVNRSTLQELNGLMLNEAWAEFGKKDSSKLFDSYSIKIGRQELAYNDHRLLGNLDWLQQGRRHDMVLIKLGSKELNVHAGAAYNQNKEIQSGSTYMSNTTMYPSGSNGIGHMYKSLTFLYLNRKFKKVNPHIFLINDNFTRFTLDADGTTYIYSPAVNSRFTTGSQVEIGIGSKNLLNLSGYYQFGKDKTGKSLSAFAFFCYSSIALSEKLSTGPGFDYLSGTDDRTVSGVNNTFDPLYGTPHKFYGLMDYFYVASAFGQGGLVNGYLKTKYSANKKLALSLDYHYFHSANKIGNSSTANTNDYFNASLGNEFDFVINYLVMDNVSLEFGYCIMLGTNTLDQLKNKIVDNRNIGNWIYFMFNIKPGTFIVNK